MKSEDAALMINTAFSIVELVIRMRQQNPQAFLDQTEKIQTLKQKLTELEEKPDDYLQQWDG